MSLRAAPSFFGSCAALILSFAPAGAEEPIIPKDSIEVAYVTILQLCPAIVGAGGVPETVKLEDYGLEPSRLGRGDWQGKFNDGVVIVDFDAENRSCATSLGVPESLSFGDFIIAQLEKNGFTLLVDRRNEPVSGGVWVKFSSDRARRSQFTVVKNPTGPLLTVSYTEKAN
jgi:hypothetical protein